jgi:hypothetical protein
MFDIFVKYGKFAMPDEATSRRPARRACHGADRSPVSRRPYSRTAPSHGRLAGRPSARPAVSVLVVEAIGAAMIAATF